MPVLIVLLSLVIFLFAWMLYVQIKRIDALKLALRQNKIEKYSCLQEAEKLREAISASESKNKNINSNSNNLFKVYKILKEQNEALLLLHNKLIEESVTIKDNNINLISENTILKEKQINILVCLESSVAKRKEANINFENMQCKYDDLKQDYKIAIETHKKSTEVYSKLVTENNNITEQLDTKTKMYDIIVNDNDMYKKNAIITSDKILILDSEIEELKTQNEDLVRYVVELEDEHTANESNELESLVNKRKEIEEEIYQTRRDVFKLKEQLEMDKTHFQVVGSELAAIRKESGTEIDKLTYIKSLAKGAGKHLESLCAVSGRRSVTQIKKLCRICENTPSMPGDDLCMDCARNT